MKWMIAAIAVASAAVAPLPAQQPSAPATPKPIPTETLAKKALLSEPMLSPDGSMLLAMLGTDGPSALGLLWPATGEIRSFAMPKGYEVVSYRWAGDAKVLISLGKTANLLGEEVYVTRLVAYDVAGRTSSFVGKRDQGVKGDDILYIDPGGGWLLLSIQNTIYDYPSVHRVDLSDGSMKEVVGARPGVLEWFADGGGRVRAGIHFDRNRWSLLYRGPAASAFREVGGARYEDERAAIGLPQFAPDGDQGYALSSEKTGRDAIHRFDFATFKTGELVFEAPANDISGFYLSEDGRRVEAAYYTDVRDRVHWFDPEMKEIQAAIDKAVGAKEAWIVSTSRDKSRMLVLVTGANDPGSYYFFQPGAGVMKRLAYINEAMKGHRLAPATPISYAARDGLTIHGYLTLPPGRAGKGLPLIVLPHGGPYGVRDRGDYDPLVQLLANRGYAVLQPNYRGSDSYGRAFEAKGTGQWGRAMQDDLDDGMDWLVRDGVVDPKRVCIAGGSYGGYAALWGATRNPERYRCAVSFAGVTDLPRQLKYSREYFMNGASARKWRDRVRGDESFNLADISPLGHVAKLRVPVLVAHGEDDQTVPLKQSALYAAALAKAGKPHEYAVYKAEGHGLSDPANRKDYFDRIEAFLRKHNPPD